MSSWIKEKYAVIRLLLLLEAPVPMPPAAAVINNTSTGRMRLPEASGPAPALSTQVIGHH
jgi:hypothetical protein